MKSNLLLAIGLTLVLAMVGLCGCSQGSPIELPESLQVNLNSQQEGIWVTGKGEVMAVPDIAELRLGVEARANTVSEAQAQASEAMDKVMEALKDNGVAEKDIQTQRFSIYPVTRWLKERDEEEIVGYRVTNIVLAKIREVDKAGAIIDAVAKASGNLTRIQGISFTVDDPTPYYEEARNKALEDAKNKATQLADLAGVKLGKPTYISEGAVYWPEVPKLFPEMAGGAPVPAPPPISPGELKITVSVQVACEIN